MALQTDTQNACRPLEDIVRAAAGVNLPRPRSSRRRRG